MQKATEIIQLKDNSNFYHGRNKKPEESRYGKKKRVKNDNG